MKPSPDEPISWRPLPLHRNNASTPVPSFAEIAPRKYHVSVPPSAPHSQDKTHIFFSTRNAAPRWSDSHLQRSTAAEEQAILASAGSPSSLTVSQFRERSFREPSGPCRRALAALIPTNVPVRLRSEQFPTNVVKRTRRTAHREGRSRSLAQRSLERPYITVSSPRTSGKATPGRHRSEWA